MHGQYKEQAIFKRNLLFVWPIYTISALVIRILMITKMAYQKGYLKCNVFDGKTMDYKLDLFGIKENSRFLDVC